MSNVKIISTTSFEIFCHSMQPHVVIWHFQPSSDLKATIHSLCRLFNCRSFAAKVAAPHYTKQTSHKRSWSHSMVICKMPPRRIRNIFIHMFTCLWFWRRQQQQRHTIVGTSQLECCAALRWVLSQVVAGRLRQLSSHGAINKTPKRRPSKTL